MSKKLSIIIPAYNEEGSLPETLNALYNTLTAETIDHEIVVINDNSSDNTIRVLNDLQKSIPSLVYFTNTGPNGFGFAVRYGFEKFSGSLKMAAPRINCSQCGSKTKT